MFDFPSNQSIQNHRDRINAQILLSFKDNDGSSQATLIKGISLEEFNSKYSPENFERFTFESLSKAKDDLSKAEDFNQQEFDDLVKGMTPIVVSSQRGEKKLMYVKQKVAA